MPAIGGRRRPKLQGIANRWVGINQRSAVAASTNTIVPSSSSPNPQHRPQHVPAKKTKNQPTPPRRPVKRASYAGHELSSPSDLNAKANTNGSNPQSNYKYHVEALDDDDQATTITEQTGELTMFTNGSTSTFVSLESQFQNMLIHNSGLHPHQTFQGLEPEQKVTTRRCSAPPLLGLTVETPSPLPKNMSPTLHNHQDEVEVGPQNMAVKKSPPQNVFLSPNGGATNEEEIQVQDTATTVASRSATNTTSDSGVADITIPVPLLRKQVSLDPKTRIYLHLHLADFSLEEYNASFLTNEDMDRIQLENVNTIRHLRSQNTNHENQGRNDEEADTSSEYTARGLEVMSSTESVQALQQTKQAAIDAVMDQQDEQFDGEYCDHDRIAVVYMAETSDSASAAFIRGASDATYVNRFVRESHE